jgi:hypothetical protein
MLRASLSRKPIDSTAAAPEPFQRKRGYGFGTVSHVSRAPAYAVEIFEDGAWRHFDGYDADSATVASPKGFAGAAPKVHDSVPAPFATAANIDSGLIAPVDAHRLGCFARGSSARFVCRLTALARVVVVVGFVVIIVIIVDR